MTRPLAFVAGAIAATVVVWHQFGEVFVAFATIGLNSAKFSLFALSKKIGWASAWRFLQPLFVRLATWELPKRSGLWLLSLVIGARNRRLLQRRLGESKERLHEWKDLRYRQLESRFGRYTKAILGAVAVAVSVVLSVFVLGFYAFWYSASFFRGLLVLGGWVFRYALRWLKVGLFNAIALGPLRWLQAVLPARYARVIRRLNLRIAREVIRRRRTALPAFGRSKFSAGDFVRVRGKSRNGTVPPANAG